MRTEEVKLKWEVGMRPPAHRGLRLRPGGKVEKIEGKRIKVKGLEWKAIKFVRS
jgi:hypothetical protein